MSSGKSVWPTDFIIPLMSHHSAAIFNLSHATLPCPEKRVWLSLVWSHFASALWPLVCLRPISVISDTSNYQSDLTGVDIMAPVVGWCTARCYQMKIYAGPTLYRESQVCMSTQSCILMHYELFPSPHFPSSLRSSLQISHPLHVQPAGVLKSHFLRLPSVTWICLHSLLTTLKQEKREGEKR